MAAQKKGSTPRTGAAKRRPARRPKGSRKPSGRFRRASKAGGDKLKGLPKSGAGQKVGETVEKAAEQAIDAIATKGAEAAERLAGRMFDKRRNRKRAIAYARQINGGKYSEDTFVADEIRYVVWKDGAAVAVFPPLDSTDGPLSERPELQDFSPLLLKTP